MNQLPSLHRLVTISRPRSGAYKYECVHIPVSKILWLYCFLESVQRISCWCLHDRKRHAHLFILPGQSLQSDYPRTYQRASDQCGPHHSPPHLWNTLIVTLTYKCPTKTSHRWHPTPLVQTLAMSSHAALAYKTLLFPCAGIVLIVSKPNPYVGDVAFNMLQQDSFGYMYPSIIKKVGALFRSEVGTLCRSHWHGEESRCSVPLIRWRVYMYLVENGQSGNQIDKRRCSSGPRLRSSPSKT